jgi:hypothetical protein
MSAVVNQAAASETRLLELLENILQVGDMFEDPEDWTFFMSKTRRLLILFKHHPRFVFVSYSEWKAIKVFARKNEFSGSSRWKALVSKRGDRATMLQRLANLDCRMRKGVKGEFSEDLRDPDSDWVDFLSPTPNDQEEGPPDHPRI